MPPIREHAIDETDLKILSMLQTNCKQGVKKISQEVGKGISTVHSRIKTLEEKGAIKQYTAILDPVMLGRPTLAFIFIIIRYRVPGEEEVLSQRDFCKEIATHPNVQGVWVLSGQYDVLLKVRAKNVEEMNLFIVEFLRKIPAVERTLTMFAMDNYLETPELRELDTL